MMKVTTWFDKHRLAVVAYLELKKPVFPPDETGWILLLVVREIACIAAIASKSLQRHNSQLCNQHHTLVRLFDEISSKVDIVGTLLHSQRAAIDTTIHALSDSGKYGVACSAVSGLMEDLGTFVKDCLTVMNGVNRENFCDCQH